VFVPKPFEQPLGRMLLLLRSELVVRLPPPKSAFPNSFISPSLI
jgi:hypothetical protein